MLMPMPMMVALTLMLLLDVSDVVAYADACVVANDANADVKMPNVARQLVGAYDVLLLPPLLPVLMLLGHLLRVYACDDVMLKCVCICVRLCLSTARMCVMFVYMPLCVRAFTLREQLHFKARHFLR